VLGMVRQMDKEGFGNCTNIYECEAVCPAEISVSFIAKMNREYVIASLRERMGE
jgi:succinate dehydrogenase / fumarate reductase, iron-sulfur subunit